MKSTSGEDVVLTDANPNFSAQQMLEHYIPLFPELTSATLQGPEVLTDRVRYTFSPQLGTKG